MATSLAKQVTSSTKPRFTCHMSLLHHSTRHLSHSSLRATPMVVRNTKTKHKIKYLITDKNQPHQI